MSDHTYCSVAKSCLTLCDPMDCRMPGGSVLYCLSEFAQIHVHYVGMLPNHLLLPSSPLPSVFPSMRLFFSELSLHIRWPKNWSFSFSISPSRDYSGLISFRIDWFGLLAFYLYLCYVPEAVLIDIYVMTTVLMRFHVVSVLKTLKERCGWSGERTLEDGRV